MPCITNAWSNANRYTFVWGKAIKTSKERIKQQVDELWKYAQSVAASELDDTDPSSFKKIGKEVVTATVETINNALKDKKIEGKVRQKLNYARKHWPAALERYEQQEKILGQRNSYSKTDPDATFMRMKEDHMRNGQLKPGYNVQISTNNQFIASYSLPPNPTDTKTLIPHLQQHVKAFKQKPANITADAGYGSEENYQWLENKRIKAYVKHNYFDRNQKAGLHNPFAAENFHFDGRKIAYCPSGKVMHKIGTKTQQSPMGFKQTFTLYQAKKCAGCPLREQCHDQKGKQRCFDTEPVFAQIKHNHQFKRFLLRGIDKVNVEFGLLVLAHNLRKKIA